MKGYTQFKVNLLSGGESSAGEWTIGGKNVFRVPLICTRIGSSFITSKTV